MHSFFSARVRLPRLLVFALSAVLAASCASTPADSGGAGPEPGKLKAPIEALDSSDARARKDAQEQILGMGPVVCRNLGREVSGRLERLDAGPGFVCLLRLLGALGGQEACVPLSSAARKRALDPAVRVEAIRALGTLGRPEAVGALLECASESEPLPLQLASLKALAAHATATPVRAALHRLMALGDAGVREEAARSMLSCAEPDTRSAFRIRLLDASPSVRIVAATYFTLHPDPEAEILLRTLTGHDTDLRVVMAAGKALKALGK